MKNVMILIADASRARLFETDRHDAPFTLLKSLEHSASRAPDTALGTDRPGRSRKGLQGSPRTALEPNSSRHELEAQRFARELSGLLETMLNSESERRLVLVAPPRFLGLLRKELSPAVARRVIQSLDRDLTNMTALELPEALSAALV